MPTRVASLSVERDAGRLSRDAYWEAMKEAHLSLLDYQSLLTRAHLASLTISPSSVEVVTDDDVRIGWDPSDLRSPVAVSINDGEYERDEWTVIRAFGVRAGTLLDVGANIGWYSLRLAAVRGDTPGIHAFEPVPRTFDQLAANVARNGFEGRVAVHAFGLSDREDDVTFYLPTATGSVAASERPLFAHELQELVTVRLRTLDAVRGELGSRPIDFIKCDVEGGEFGFLRGATATIEGDRPTILLELLRKWGAVYGYHPNDVIEWMADRGYVCAAIGDQSVQRIDAVTDATMETNFLFVAVDRRNEVRDVLTPEIGRVDL